MTQPNNFNQQVIDYFRANGGAGLGRFAGRRLLLLTTKGARSGKSRTTPLVYSEDAGRMVVVASMGGAPRNPAWFHNLRAHPEVTLEVGHETLQARASVARPGERERLYAQHAAEMPAFDEYQKNTTRQIPVVVLERIP